MPDRQVRCPVCGRLAGPRAQACGQCGWTLSGPLRMGQVTKRMREDFEADLNRRRRALDAHVVARIAANPGPYQDCIRGGPPDKAEWQAARSAAAAETAGASDEDELTAGLRNLLDELEPGTSITVVEVGADGIAMTRTDLDRFGSPRVTGIGETTWTSMLPMLSAETEQRRFQLAGGLLQSDRELAWDRLDRELPAIPRGPLGVVCRVAGWEIPERAARAVTRRGARLLRVAGTADSTPVRTLLADLAAQAPLRHAYQLMVAVLAPGSGAVSIRPRRLFAPGDRPGTEASLPLRRLPGDRSDLVLAIFADGAASDPLALYQAQSPAGSAFELRAVLDGPGRVRILQPENPVEYPGDWAEARGEVPPRVETVPRPADLICAVDLSGPRKAMRRRRKLIGDLLTLLDAEYGESPWLRIGVVTCTDHLFERGRYEDHVTEHAELGSPGAAAAWLTDRTQPDETDPKLAPVEDLLYEAFLMLGDRRDRGRPAGRAAGDRAAMVVTAAGHPPHPWPQPPDERMPCPNKYAWTTEMDNLIRRAGARCLMVSDDPKAGVEGIEDWRKLGPGGLRTLADTSARQLAEDLGLVAAKAQRIPLPLDDDVKEGNR
jgi:hypothetical protein